MNRRTYGFDRVKLYEHYTADELTDMAAALRADPQNAGVAGSIWLYNKRTNKRLANIAHAITYHLRDAAKNAESAA